MVTGSPVSKLAAGLVTHLAATYPPVNRIDGLMGFTRDPLRLTAG
jgi:hypothetical protein